MDADDLNMLLGDASTSPATGGSDIWVVAETRGGSLSRATLEALGAARELADRLGAYVRVALLGAGVAELAGDLIAHGADRVSLADDARLSPFAPEAYLTILSAQFAEARPEVLLLVASQDGSDLAARLAARLGAGLVTGCVNLDLDEATRTVIARRPVYRGLYEEEWIIPQERPQAYAAVYDAMQTAEAQPYWARPQVFTLRPGAFSALPSDPARSGQIERMPVPLDDFRASVRRLGPAEYAGPVDHHGEPVEAPLQRARRVVAVGRGLVNENGKVESEYERQDARAAKEGLKLARQLAERLGAALAGDHTAYELGWVDDRHVVGITNPAIAPELYIACGIRGDAQHLAGMSDSHFVVAIHADPDAPIFQTADLGVVGAPVEVLRQLLQQAW